MYQVFSSLEFRYAAIQLPSLTLFKIIPLLYSIFIYAKSSMQKKITFLYFTESGINLTLKPFPSRLAKVFISVFFEHVH